MRREEHFHQTTNAFQALRPTKGWGNGDLKKEEHTRQLTGGPAKQQFVEQPTSGEREPKETLINAFGKVARMKMLTPKGAQDGKGERERGRGRSRRTWKGGDPMLAGGITASQAYGKKV